LKSDLRQLIVGDYVSIDVKNSQPFLLGVLLGGILNPRDTLCWYLHEDSLIKTFGATGIKQISLVHQKQEIAEMVNFRSYHESVLQGRLYENFMAMHKGNIDRSQAKEIMFHVFFSKNVDYDENGRRFVPYEKDKKIFSSVYPLVGEAVRILKVKRHNILSIYLQKLESYLFIDRIAKELVGHGIIPFTIHDSVIVDASDQELTLKIMTKVFREELGVVPALDIKKL
jgi:hypothetical protein